MKLLKNNIFNGIIISVAFAFNILIFAPIEMYYTNKVDLWFKISSILIFIIPLAFVVSLILSLILIRSNKKEKTLFPRIFATFLTCLYIQGNYLNFGYHVLDGSDVDWFSMLVKGLINTAVWLALVIIPYELKIIKKNKDNFKRYTSVLSLFIMGIEIITLIVLVLSSRNAKKDNALSTENIMNLSKDNNVIVIMSDTFEGTYMNQILLLHPEFKEQLKDFTYFDNATSVSFFTYSSMPTLLTGEVCSVDNTLYDNLNDCFNNTDMYDILKDNNFSREIYVEDALIPETDKVDNLVDEVYNVKFKSVLGINKNMYKVVLYRYLPHFLKSFFIVGSEDFYSVKSNNRKDLNYREKEYSMDDVAFNNSLVQDGITTNLKKNAFKFYQMEGMHRPYTMTVDLKYDNSDEYAELPTEERRIYEGIASLKLLCNYVEELKKAGVYDNTNIIFLADHGYDNRFYVNLLVKRANDSHDFQISSAPVSTLTDLKPTILNMATNSKDYGKDFFDYEEGEKRTRQVNDFTYRVNVFGRNDYNVISKMVFESDDIAKKEDSFKIVDEQYKYDDKELTEKYEFGKILDIGDIEESKSVNLKGFTLEDVYVTAPKGTNINKNTYITVNRKEAQKDVLAKFYIDKVYGKNQRIVFRLNGEEISSSRLVEKKANVSSVVIPKEEWNLRDLFTLEVDFPNAILGEEEFTMMVAVKLKSIIFTEIE